MIWKSQGVHTGVRTAYRHRKLMKIQLLPYNRHTFSVDIQTGCSQCQTHAAYLQLRCAQALAVAGWSTVHDQNDISYLQLGAVTQP